MTWVDDEIGMNQHLIGLHNRRVILLFTVMWRMGLVEYADVIVSTRETVVRLMKSGEI